MNLVKFVFTCVLFGLGRLANAGNCEIDKDGILDLVGFYKLGDNVNQLNEKKWNCTLVNDAGYGECSLKHDKNIIYTVTSNNGVNYLKGGEVLGVSVLNLYNKKIMGVSAGDDLQSVVKKLLKYNKSINFYTDNNGRTMLGSVVCLERIRQLNGAVKLNNQDGWFWAYRLDKKSRIMGFELMPKLPYF